MDLGPDDSRPDERRVRFDVLENQPRAELVRAYRFLDFGDATSALTGEAEPVERELVAGDFPASLSKLSGVK